MITLAEAVYPSVYNEARASLSALAHHEAGHAVVAAARGVRIFYATIIPQLNSLGHVLHQPLESMTVADGIVVTLAGPAASSRHYPWDGLDCPMNFFDMPLARSLIAALHGSDQPEAGSDARLDRWLALARREVDQHWPWICAVAEGLEMWRRLTGAQIIDLKPVKAARPDARKMRGFLP